MILINKSDFPDDKIKEITGALLEGQLAPSFYLIVQTHKHTGLTLTNLDMPTVIIVPDDLHDFAEIFVHELVHLQQHAKGYSSEEEAYNAQATFRTDREIVVSE